MRLIFVYGTLKSGNPNNYLMSKELSGICNPRGLAFTKERYPLVVASRYNVPYLLYKPGIGYHIEGELYEVDDAQLGRLDQLESHPKMYIRKDVTVTRDKDVTAEEIQAQTYFLVNFRPNLLQLPLLESYQDETDGRKYIRPDERDVPAPMWWYEVNTGYEKDD